MEIEIFGIIEIAVLPWQLVLCDGIWDLPFYLGNDIPGMMEFGIAVLPWQSPGIFDGI